MRRIKSSDVALVPLLKNIFANSLSCGVFPAIWKCAIVVPVDQKDEKNVKGNFRPVSRFLEKYFKTHI